MLFISNRDPLAFHRYDDSVIFQPINDSTEFFQLLLADDTAFVTGDTTNTKFSIAGDLAVSQQFFLGGVTSTSTPTDTTSNLLAHYKMNDVAANNIVVDTIGAQDGIYRNGQYGNQNTSTKSVAGKINTALTFDGTGDNIEITGLTSTNQSYTFSMWVKSTQNGVTDKRLFMSAASGWFILQWRSGARRIGFYDGTSSREYSGEENTGGDGDWHHLVFIFNSVSSNSSLYVDGAKFGSTVSYTPNDIGGDVRIASDSVGTDSRNFIGELDDFRIYERVLSVEDITQLWNDGDGTETSEIGALGATHQVVGTTSSYQSPHGLDSLADLAVEGDHEVNGNDWVDTDQDVAGDQNVDGDATVGGNLVHTGANVGVLGATPVAQQTHIVDADGTLADVTTKFNTLLTYLETTTGFGFIADS